MEGKVFQDVASAWLAWTWFSFHWLAAVASIPLQMTLNITWLAKDLFVSSEFRKKVEKPDLQKNELCGVPSFQLFQILLLYYGLKWTSLFYFSWLKAFIMNGFFQV